MQKSFAKFAIVFVVIAVFIGAGFFVKVNASAENGTIDSTYKYAWSDNGGWLNFGTTEGNVHITHTALTGYVWNENYGWINLAPAQSGVINNGQGNLSGYAWGENVGWVDFDEVSINCGGEFRGTATNDVLGTITFTCTNCKVLTDYVRGGCGGLSPSPSPTPLPPPPPYCGDAECNGSETCNTCPADCGECVLPLPENPTPPGPSEPTPPPEPVVIVPPIIPPEIKKIIEEPIVSISTKVITTTSIAVVVVATAFASPITLPELFLIPARLMGLLLSAFGLKKRKQPWGTVYDSVTKQPLDPAYVILKNTQGKEISTAITDLDGRYGFLADSGFYIMTANKTNYLFPSQKLAGKIADELYDNLYFGEQIEIKQNEAIIKNIPLDPLKFDWNEFAKRKKNLMKFYSKWDAFMRGISDILFLVGFIVALVAFFAAPYPYNTIILGTYALVALLRIFGLKPKPFGLVTETSGGIPLAFAIIRIVDASGREVSHKITDKYGRYLCLLPKGKYFVKIEKKNVDGSYSSAYTSHLIDATKNGIIKNKFKI